MESPFLTTVFFFISAAAVIWIIVGLVSPKTAGQTRKNVLIYGGITAIVSMVLAGVFVPPQTPEEKAAIEQQQKTNEVKEAKNEPPVAEKAAEEKKDEHPHMKVLTADNHPKFGDTEKSTKKFYDKADLEDRVVYSEGTQSNKKNDDWLFWYAFRKDAVCEVSCALSRINGGMTLEEAMPIMLSYLPDGEVKNHKRSFYKEDKSDSSKGIYCFQFTGQLYLTAYVEDGCVSKFIVGSSEPNTGRGKNDTHTYKEIKYDLTPFVK